MAAMDTRPENRGWAYFVLWIVSVIMGLLLLSCVLGILFSAVWTAVAPGP
tara:strand:+ start:19490 stop:19639 length:150 start_codon:yes stop_codon:yes gene_type:complete